MIRFLIPWRQFMPGDVCDTYDIGVQQTMVDCGRAVFVSEPNEKSFTAPPHDKMIHPENVKRKRGRPRKVEIVGQ